MMADVRELVPGDAIVLKVGTQLESAVRHMFFSITHKTVYSICIARVENTTIHGVTMRRVYLLTPQGLGFKRFNLNAEPKPGKSFNTEVEDWW